MKCEVCQKEITKGTARYSLNAFGRELCFECQKKERLKRYPEKLAEFLNKKTDLFAHEGRGGSSDLGR